MQRVTVVPPTINWRDIVLPSATADALDTIIDSVRVEEQEEKGWPPPAKEPTGIIDEVYIKNSPRHNEIMFERLEAYESAMTSLKSDMIKFPFDESNGEYALIIGPRTMLVEVWSGVMDILMLSSQSRMWSLTQPISFPAKIYLFCDRNGNQIQGAYTIRPYWGFHLIDYDANDMQHPGTICFGKLERPERGASLKEHRAFALKIVEALKRINVESLGSVHLPEGNPYIAPFMGTEALILALTNQQLIKPLL